MIIRAEIFDELKAIRRKIAVAIQDVTHGVSEEALGKAPKLDPYWLSQEFSENPFGAFYKLNGLCGLTVVSTDTLLGLSVDGRWARSFDGLYRLGEPATAVWDSFFRPVRTSCTDGESFLRAVEKNRVNEIGRKRYMRDAEASIMSRYVSDVMNRAEREMTALPDPTRAT